ncbi:MAG: hypothetical protein JW791_00260 [Nanoarchaeota archaeon]|nr:hypothetical protein [Nanoarchaeota archaeon]
MGLFDFLKKKGLSPKSANFARLVKSYCAESGIPVQTQLLVTKAISRDFIEKSGKSINDFLFMPHDQAKLYLMKNGMADMDCEIFLNILLTNKDSFMTI